MKISTKNLNIRNQLIALCLISAILVACDGPTKPSKQTASIVDSSNLTIKTNDPQNLFQTTITITKSMLDNPSDLKMSDYIDDISFIRLETSKESFVKSTKSTEYTKDFISFYVNHFFTWDGKWKANIGIKGGGPYEEPEGTFNDAITFKNGKFYSKGYKLLEYDINGNPTKKVRNELGETKATGSTLSYGGRLVAAGKYLFSSAPDAVYFVDTANFETVKRIELIPNNISMRWLAQHSSGRISHYRDEIIYTYPFIDTIFYVKDTSLQPIYKLQIDEDVRVPIDYFHQIEELVKDFMKKGGKMREMLRGKGAVVKCEETNKYLFLQFDRFGDDGLTKSTFYIIYDKNLMTSKVVRAEDFINDIIGQGDNSQLQIIDEKIVMAFWPHEIFDIIDQKKAAGENVHPKLTELAKQINEEDNPVIFVGHLKK